jgi:glycosyltransferase involved in cell wall biosynthesis
MNRVLIVQTVVPQYRVPFFEKLHEVLRAESTNLSVAYGDKPGADAAGSQSTLGELSFGFKTRSLWFFGGRLLVQPVLREVLDADLVIVEQANKHLLNYFLLLLSLLRIKKVAFWGHGRNRQRRNSSGLWERLKARFVRQADWWFAYTRSVATYLESCGVEPRKITVVQNSLDVESFRSQLEEIGDKDIERARVDLGLQAGSAVGLFCGRLTKDKKLPFLMRAASLIKARVPDFHLVILGDGPEENAVTDFASRHDWIRYMGARLGREKALYFKVAHVWLNPGIITLGILDAFCGGLPVLTTDIGTHSPEIDYFENGENGIMCKVDLSEYANAVIDVITDRSLFSRLRSGALASADRYCLKAMVENFKSGILRCLVER